jgi:hypothetical protein
MTAAANRHDERAGPGTGMVVVRLWLAFLVLVSLVQLFFVLQTKDYAGGAGAIAIVRVYIVIGAVKVFALALALYFLVFDRSRASLYGAVAAMLFFTPLADLLADTISHYITFEAVRVRLLPFPAPLEFAVNGVAIAYLFLSARVNAVYGLRTREFVVGGTPRLWTKLRGRAPLDS